MASERSARHVLAVVPTKDRFHSTLPLTLQALIAQSRPPDQLLIYNDGQQSFPFAEPLFQETFRQLEHKGIQVQVQEGARKGQPWGHQAALEASRDLVWRVDDDEVPEPSTLARLLERMEPGVGAVAPLVVIPSYAHLPLPSVASGKIEDCLFAPNLQWFIHQGGVREVDHLYSSFLYSREAGLAAGGFCLELSPLASREETIFSFGLRQAGYRLLIDTGALIWHLRNPEGGIRAYSQPQTIESLRHDELVFLGRMERAGVKMHLPLLVSLNGDDESHRRFLTELPKLRERLGPGYLIVAARRPELLRGAQALVIPWEEKKMLSYFREIGPDGQTLAPPQAKPLGAVSPASLSFYMPVKP